MDEARLLWDDQRCSGIVATGRCSRRVRAASPAAEQYVQEDPQRDDDQQLTVARAPSVAPASKISSHEYSSKHRGAAVRRSPRLCLSTHAQRRGQSRSGSNVGLRSWCGTPRNARRRKRHPSRRHCWADRMRAMYPNKHSYEFHSKSVCGRRSRPADRRRIAVIASPSSTGLWNDPAGGSPSANGIRAAAHFPAFHHCGTWWAVPIRLPPCPNKPGA